MQKITFYLENQNMTYTTVDVECSLIDSFVRLSPTYLTIPTIKPANMIRTPITERTKLVHDIYIIIILVDAKIKSIFVNTEARKITVTKFLATLPSEGHTKTFNLKTGIIIIKLPAMKSRFDVTKITKKTSKPWTNDQGQETNNIG